MRQVKGWYEAEFKGLIYSRGPLLVSRARLWFSVFLSVVLWFLLFIIVVMIVILTLTVVLAVLCSCRFVVREGRRRWIGGLQTLMKAVEQVPEMYYEKHDGCLGHLRIPAQGRTSRSL